MRPGWTLSIFWLSVTAVAELVGASSSWRTLAQAAPRQPAAGLPTASPVSSQVQVSRQFLRALLRGDYVAAYGQLAPEVRRAVSTARFRELARPVVMQGQRHGQAIELYKLGMRLNEAGGAVSFVAFAWAADSASARQVPPQWLEVTFRNATAQQVLGFSVRKRQF